MFQTLHEISKNLIFVFVWKYVNINVSDIKKKKKKENATANLPEWPKSGTLTSPNAGDGVEQQEHRGPSPR